MFETNIITIFISKSPLEFVFYTKTPYTFKNVVDMFFFSIFVLEYIASVDVNK